MGTLIVFGIFMTTSFVIGIYLGQKLNKNEQIEINPIKALEEHIEDRKIKKEIKEETSKLEIMLDNIDNYDGTGIGQKDIPR